MTTNTLTQPIAKLYKRCALNHHDTCPGAFETWSVCSCPCHAGVSDMRAADAAPNYDGYVNDWNFETATVIHPEMPVSTAEMPVTCADKHDAVSEAIAIVKRTVAPKLNAAGLPPIKGPKNLAGGAKCNTSSMKTYSSHSYGASGHTPTAFETCTDPHHSILAPFKAPVFSPNEAIAKCTDCRVPLYQSYGQTDGRCNHCNVKRGEMRYETTTRSQNGTTVEDVNVIKIKKGGE